MSYDVAIVGAGFIGSTLAKYLSHYYKVITFDVNPDPPLLKQVKTVEHRVCDVTHYNEINKKIGKPKVILHTAIIQIPRINEMKDYAYEVNVIGTHNICKAVKDTKEVLGLILCGSWHVFGEREYGTTVDVTFGYRPDKVEERARLYVISKMLQEGIVRFYNSMVNEKTYGIIRLGTVLGENMPEKTAANIFITNGIQGKPITPFKHTMHRPMLYIAIDDICKVFKSYIDNIIMEHLATKPSDDNIYNLFYPQPITILELAESTREAIILHTQGKISPTIKIVDKDLPILFDPNEKQTLKADITETTRFFGIQKLKNPKETISKIVKTRMKN
jgi:UDP-glucose 4-epimerase